MAVSGSYIQSRGNFEVHFRGHHVTHLPWRTLSSSENPDVHVTNELCHVTHDRPADKIIQDDYYIFKPRNKLSRTPEGEKRTTYIIEKPANSLSPDSDTYYLTNIRYVFPGSYIWFSPSHEAKRSSVFGNKKFTINLTKLLQCYQLAIKNNRHGDQSLPNIHFRCGGTLRFDKQACKVIIVCPVECPKLDKEVESFPPFDLGGIGFGDLSQRQITPKLIYEKISSHLPKEPPSNSNTFNERFSHSYYERSPLHHERSLSHRERSPLHHERSPLHHERSPSRHERSPSCHDRHSLLYRSFRDFSYDRRHSSLYFRSPYDSRRNSPCSFDDRRCSPPHNRRHSIHTLYDRQQRYSPHGYDRRESPSFTNRRLSAPYEGKLYSDDSRYYVPPHHSRHSLDRPRDESPYHFNHRRLSDREVNITQRHRVTYAFALYFPNESYELKCPADIIECSKVRHVHCVGEQKHPHTGQYVCPNFIVTREDRDREEKKRRQDDERVRRREQEKGEREDGELIKEDYKHEHKREDDIKSQNETRETRDDTSSRQGMTPVNCTAMKRRLDSVVISDVTPKRRKIEHDDNDGFKRRVQWSA